MISRRIEMKRIGLKRAHKATIVWKRTQNQHREKNNLWIMQSICFWIARHPLYRAENIQKGILWAAFEIFFSRKNLQNVFLALGGKIPKQSCDAFFTEQRSSYCVFSFPISGRLTSGPALSGSDLARKGIYLVFSCQKRILTFVVAFLLLGGRVFKKSKNSPGSKLTRKSIK